MTRETKIGLLVGLTFIIIVGVLLGDSVRHATDVPLAALPLVADNVRSGVTTPVSRNGGNNFAGQSQNNIAQIVPQQPVPTREEASRPATGIVIIGPGTTQNGQQVNQFNNQQFAGNHPNPLTLGSVNQSQPMAYDPNDALRNIARMHGEELVTPTSVTRSFGPNGQPNQNLPRNNAQRSHTVASGDTLGKIASKYYGSSAKQYQLAIINANPSLKNNPDRIILNQTYIIPTVEGAPANSSGPTQVIATADNNPQHGLLNISGITNTPRQINPPQPIVIPAARGGNSSVGATEYFYTVKENDSLWRIARDQVGDPAAVASIKEMNKEVLKGSETVKINMKLRLPGRPVAMAN